MGAHLYRTKAILGHLLTNHQTGYDKCGKEEHRIKAGPVTGSQLYMTIKVYSVLVLRPYVLSPDSNLKIEPQENDCCSRPKYSNIHFMPISRHFRLLEGFHAPKQAQAHNLLL